MSQSKDELMATVAVWALLNINPEEKTHVETAIPLLRRALRGDRELVRIEAAVALGDIGAAATAAVPILELVSEDDSSKSVRSAAAEALAKIRAASGPR
jgi:HEAT repeat protein